MIWRPFRRDGAALRGKLKGKISRIALGALGVSCALSLTHAWLNFGFDPVRALGLKKGTEVAEETRFRVGFLPMT